MFIAPVLHNITQLVLFTSFDYAYVDWEGGQCQTDCVKQIDTWPVILEINFKIIQPEPFSNMIS
jgi:hypothetical protein